jgi:hypothetical protein
MQYRINARRFLGKTVSDRHSIAAPDRRQRRNASMENKASMHPEATGHQGGKGNDRSAGDALAEQHTDG